jgi:hypothetical protein
MKARAHYSTSQSGIGEVLVEVQINDLWKPYVRYYYGPDYLLDVNIAHEIVRRDISVIRQLDRPLHREKQSRV